MIVPDVLTEGLALVLCGTAPSRTSKEAKAYYAHPGNIFWRTLFDVGLTRRLLAPRDYRQILEFGVGLTDLNKTEWGADAQLNHSAFDVESFRAKMGLYRPSVIAFDSKFAAKKYYGRATVRYGLQEDTLFASHLFVVPSTSGRARGYFEIAHWRELASLVERYR